MKLWSLILVLGAFIIPSFEGQAVTSKQKFKLSALNLSLRDKDGSDPYVKCFIKSNVNRAYEKFGESSTLYKNINPIWPDEFVYQFVNGTNQKLKFLVKDWEFWWIADRHLGRAEVNTEDLVNEMIKGGVNGTMSDKPIQLFLTQPKGGILVYTPIFD